MKISIQDVGPLSSAEVEINGITVITGENNTGKSIVGKSLFAILNAQNNLEKKVKNAIKKASGGVSWSKGEAVKAVALASFKDEFGDRICNIHHEGSIASVKIIMDGVESEVVVENDRVVDFINPRNIKLQPVLIDDALCVALDMLSYSPSSLKAFPERIIQTLGSLFPSDNAESSIPGTLRQTIFELILEKFKGLIAGRMITENGRFAYVENERTGKVLPLAGVSSGLKFFALLQEFVLNGMISEKSAVILDRPESYLHPQWQIDFAKIITAMQNVLGLHILITSCSPYLISAIDVYSKRYGINENNRYYFAECVSEGNVVRDVTGNLAVIYDSLAEPYQIIEDAAMELENTLL